MSSLISFFIINGRKTLKKFPEMNNSDFEFIENSASGYSTDSFKTRNGGANKVLRIRVTKDELWLTSHPLFAWISEQFDLLHVIPINSLLSVESEQKKLKIEFVKKGRKKKIVIISKRQNELIQLLHGKMNQ